MQLQQTHHHAEKEKFFWDRVHDFVTPRNFPKNKKFTKRNILFLITKPNPKRNSKLTIGAIG